MPVFASVSRFASFAVIILFVQTRSIDPALFDAARVFSRDTIHTMLHITLPLLAPGLIIASAILGALTLGELGATLIVTPPGFGTLAIKIYNYLHYGAATEVAGLCLLMVTSTLLAGLCIIAVLIWRRRDTGKNPGSPGERIHD
jgi:iron(III) transport system permease protein